MEMIPPWLVQWSHTVTLFDLIVWALFIVGGIIFIKKKGGKWLVEFAKAILATAKVIDHVKVLPGFVERTDARFGVLEGKIAEIHHETHKNDGSSIKDAVDRIETGVQRLDERMDNVESDVKGLNQADEQLRVEISRTVTTSD